MTAQRNVYYFAYGSNLLFARLYARTPSIRTVGTATLPGFRMSFTKPGGDGSGKCGIEQAGSDDHVMGVVYEMHVAEKPLLDEIEGVGHGYHVQEHAVVLGPRSLPIFTYHPSRIDESLLPFDWYKGFVLAGALENRFPKKYVREIEAIPCVRDQDEARRAMNFSTIGDVSALVL